MAEESREQPAASLLAWIHQVTPGISYALGAQRAARTTDCLVK